MKRLVLAILMITILGCGTDSSTSSEATGNTANNTTNLNWSPTIVGSNVTGLLSSSIQIDTADKVHLSYSTDNGTYYMSNKSGAWVKETITSGKYADLAVDSNNSIHIASCLYDLKYITNVSGSWTEEIIETYPSAIVTSSSLVLDSSNKAHIVYYETNSGSLKYATNKNGAWEISTIDTNRVGAHNDIAINTNGKLHISYRDELNNDLKYATNASGTWQTQAIDTNGNVGMYTSIAVDSGNKVHIAYKKYNSESNAELKYATNSTGVWTTETIDGQGICMQTSIAIDRNGKMHITYYNRVITDIVEGDLKYATNLNGSWAVYTAYSSGVAGLFPATAVDSHNGLHIITQGNGYLYHFFKQI